METMAAVMVSRLLMLKRNAASQTSETVLMYMQNAEMFTGKIA